MVIEANFALETCDVIWVELNSLPNLFVVSMELVSPLA